MTGNDNPAVRERWRWPLWLHRVSNKAIFSSGTNRAAQDSIGRAFIASLVDALSKGLHVCSWHITDQPGRSADVRWRGYTRNGLDWTKRFSAIAGALDIPGQAIIDGEVVVIHEGRTNFSELQAELAAGRQDRLVYYAFDLLWRDGDLASFRRSSASRRCWTSLGRTTSNCRCFIPTPHRRRTGDV